MKVFILLLVAFAALAARVECRSYDNNWFDDNVVDELTDGGSTGMDVMTDPKTS